MFEFLFMLFHSRRFFIVSAIIVADLFLMSLLASAAQNRHVSAAPRADVSTAPVQTYDNPNIITDGFMEMNDSVSRTIGEINQAFYDSADTVGLGAAKFSAGVIRGAGASGRFVAHDIVGGSVGAIRAVGSGIVGGSVAVGKGIGSGIVDGFTAAGNAASGGATFVGHDVVVGSISLVGRGAVGITAYEFSGVGSVVGAFGDVAHVSDIIKPAEHTTSPTPTITELRIQQAALIQSGTRNVLVAALTSGTGGLCDSGDGNGGYPAAWCNASMDSVATIPYSGDPINRECTSYAFWYFTQIEGHYNFHVWGNAKDWANTSNYATHAFPAVGAIAVETAGAYGHVAIVQALPGQKFAGQVVPAGDVLVSEMNYDWNGHFRYSYSPLDKFSAFIYQ